VPKFRPSDDGKVIDGKIVVFLHPPRVAGDVDSSGANGPSAAAQERQATAAAAQATRWRCRR